MDKIKLSGSWLHFPMFCWVIWRETSFVNRTALYEILILDSIELVDYDDNRRKVEFPKLIGATARGRQIKNYATHDA